MTTVEHPDALMSRLFEAAPGFGQPASLLAGSQARTDGKRRLVDLHGSANALSAAQTLLTPGDWHLLRMLAPDDTSTIDIQYYVERAGAQFTSRDARHVSVKYPDPVRPKAGRCAIMCGGGAVGLLPQPIDEAKVALRDYGIATDFDIPPGRAGESLHWQVRGGQKELGSLLTVMWLLHLDVAAGSEPRVRVDNQQVRRGLVRSRGITQECEEAKALPGIRMHVHSGNSTLRALLSAACDRTTVLGGLSLRAERYDWPHVSLTLYGGILPASTEETLNSPDATARAILSFAESFGAIPEASAALSTALVLYGVEHPGTRAVLDVGLPALHEQTHRVTGGAAGLVRVRELANPSLHALAMFIGRAYSQSAAMVLRSAIRATGANDIPGAEVYLRQCQQKLMMDCGAAFSREWNALRPTLLNHADYIYVNARRLWLQSGIVHAVLGGIMAQGSIAEEACQPLKLGMLSDANPSDIPAAGKDRVDDMISWQLLSHLISDAGENLVGSRDAMKRGLGGGRIPLHRDVRLFEQSTAQLVFAGIGSPVFVNPAAETKSELRPTREACSKDTSMTSQPSVDVTEQMQAELPKPKPAEWVQDLVNQRGPAASTTMRRGRRSVVVAPNETDKQPVFVYAVEEEAMDAMQLATEHSWGPQATDGTGMLCGARALHQSLGAVKAVEGERAPTFDHVLATVRNALTPEQQETAAQAGVEVGAENFTVDQLAAGLALLGPYRLGVVNRVEGATHVRVWGADDGGQVVLVDHDGINHWSGVGPRSTSRYLPAAPPLTS
ncbi:ORF2 [Penicillium janczewskii chrysovirus 2]|uniref:ORF2 n=1 Tax=Penicillium janczewskii chrysovirus 2 TaxID=1755793 RepID=A0A0S2KQ51_9VIRU|nr:ORF2 [Penicillium janczewskii chrysovirus 2]ALO50150.1 ORF2 [Penicillium janczewskii chrysovirus 2]